jgi:hypothetical protein
MEVHPDVFVSNVATEEWQADPEIGGGAEEHVLFDTGTMRAGLSRFTKDADQYPRSGRCPPPRCYSCSKVRRGSKLRMDLSWS